MKLTSSLTAIIVSLALALTSLSADAKRMGGGQSFGKQSQNVTNRQVLGQQKAAPNQPQQGQQAAPAKPGTPPAAAPAAPKPWGAMLGGLAAGLGLAWLANSLGLGGALSGAISSILLILLIGGAAMLIWNMLRRSRSNRPAQPAFVPAYANDYSPANVGNDSAARPFERSAFANPPITTPSSPTPAAAGSGSGSIIGSSLRPEEAVSGAAADAALKGAQSWGIPLSFDVPGFLAGAKTHFVNLQAAWDKADLVTLGNMLTPEMLAEIKKQIVERDSQPTTGGTQTQVISVEAELLGIEEIPAGLHAAHYMASIEFSGVIQEEVGVSPAPFREVWNFTKPVAGGGWLVAGIQALE